jgi:uncharacterized protein (TIGR02145 family)
MFFIILHFVCGCKKNIDNTPVISTDLVQNIGSTSAVSGGNITSDGGLTLTGFGVCWSTVDSPTIKDNKTIADKSVMSFTSYLTGLMPKTTYYIRAYATYGNKTVYGKTLLFKTEDVVTDIDGNVYNTITIGSQVWMAENLKTTKYRNGNIIGTTTPATLDLANEITPKYQWAYDGNESNVATYGRLYTWYAIADNRNVCPAGWHIPTNAEWTTMENYLIANGHNYDGTIISNFIAKSLGASTGWKLSTVIGSVGNTDFTSYRNKSGFTALPGGCRYCRGSFSEIGESGYWWCSNTDNARYWELGASGNGVGWGYESLSGMTSSYSVRCVKD